MCACVLECNASFSKQLALRNHIMYLNHNRQSIRHQLSVDFVITQAYGLLFCGANAGVKQLDPSGIAM